MQQQWPHSEFEKAECETASVFLSVITSLHICRQNKRPLESISSSIWFFSGDEKKREARKHLNVERSPDAPSVQYSLFCTSEEVLRKSQHAEFSQPWSTSEPQLLRPRSTRKFTEWQFCLSVNCWSHSLSKTIPNICHSSVSRTFSFSLTSMSICHKLNWLWIGFRKWYLHP